MSSAQKEGTVGQDAKPVAEAIPDLDSTNVLFMPARPSDNTRNPFNRPIRKYDQISRDVFVDLDPLDKSPAKQRVKLDSVGELALTSPSVPAASAAKDDVKDDPTRPVSLTSTFASSTAPADAPPNKPAAVALLTPVPSPARASSAPALSDAVVAPTSSGLPAKDDVKVGISTPATSTSTPASSTTASDAFAATASSILSEVNIDAVIKALANPNSRQAVAMALDKPVLSPVSTPAANTPASSQADVKEPPNPLKGARKSNPLDDEDLALIRDIYNGVPKQSGTPDKSLKGQIKAIYVAFQAIVKAGLFTTRLSDFEKVVPWSDRLGSDQTVGLTISGVLGVTNIKHVEAKFKDAYGDVRTAVDEFVKESKLDVKVADDIPKEAPKSVLKALSAAVKCVEIVTKSSTKTIKALRARSVAPETKKLLNKAAKGLSSMEDGGDEKDDDAINEQVVRICKVVNAMRTKKLLEGDIDAIAADLGAVDMKLSDVLGKNSLNKLRELLRGQKAVLDEGEQKETGKTVSEKLTFKGLIATAKKTITGLRKELAALDEERKDEKKDIDAVWSNLQQAYNAGDVSIKAAPERAKDMLSVLKKKTDVKSAQSLLSKRHADQLNVFLFGKVDAAQRKERSTDALFKLLPGDETSKDAYVTTFVANAAASASSSSTSSSSSSSSSSSAISETKVDMTGAASGLPLLATVVTALDNLAAAGPADSVSSTVTPTKTQLGSWSRTIEKFKEVPQKLKDLTAKKKESAGRVVLSKDAKDAVTKAFSALKNTMTTKDPPVPNTPDVSLRVAWICTIIEQMKAKDVFKGVSIDQMADALTPFDFGDDNKDVSLKGILGSSNVIALRKFVNEQSKAIHDIASTSLGSTKPQPDASIKEVMKSAVAVVKQMNTIVKESIRAATNLQANYPFGEFKSTRMAVDESESQSGSQTEEKELRPATIMKQLADATENSTPIVTRKDTAVLNTYLFGSNDTGADFAKLLDKIPKRKDAQVQDVFSALKTITDTVTTVLNVLSPSTQPNAPSSTSTTTQPAQPTQTADKPKPVDWIKSVTSFAEQAAKLKKLVDAKAAKEKTGGELVSKAAVKKLELCVDAIKKSGMEEASAEEKGQSKVEIYISRIVGVVSAVLVNSRFFAGSSFSTLMNDIRPLITDDTDQSLSQIMGKATRAKVVLDLNTFVEDMNKAAKEAGLDSLDSSKKSVTAILKEVFKVCKPLFALVARANKVGDTMLQQYYLPASAKERGTNSQKWIDNFDRYLSKEKYPSMLSKTDAAHLSYLLYGTRDKPNATEATFKTIASLVQTLETLTAIPSPDQPFAYLVPTINGVIQSINSLTITAGGLPLETVVPSSTPTLSSFALSPPPSNSTSDPTVMADEDKSQSASSVSSSQSTTPITRTDGDSKKEKDKMWLTTVKTLLAVAQKATKKVAAIKAKQSKASSSEKKTKERVEILSSTVSKVDRVIESLVNKSGINFTTPLPKGGDADVRISWMCSAVKSIAGIRMFAGANVSPSYLEGTLSDELDWTAWRSVFGKSGLKSMGEHVTKVANEVKKQLDTVAISFDYYEETEPNAARLLTACKEAVAELTKLRQTSSDTSKTLNEALVGKFKQEEKVNEGVSMTNSATLSAQKKEAKLNAMLLSDRLLQKPELVATIVYQASVLFEATDFTALLGTSTASVTFGDDCKAISDNLVEKYSTKDIVKEDSTTSPKIIARLKANFVRKNPFSLLTKVDAKRLNQFLNGPDAADASSKELFATLPKTFHVSDPTGVTAKPFVKDQAPVDALDMESKVTPLLPLLKYVGDAVNFAFDVANPTQVTVKTDLKDWRDVVSKLLLVPAKLERLVKNKLDNVAVDKRKRQAATKLIETLKGRDADPARIKAEDSAILELIRKGLMKQSPSISKEEMDKKLEAAKKEIAIVRKQTVVPVSTVEILKTVRDRLQTSAEVGSEKKVYSSSKPGTKSTQVPKTVATRDSTTSSISTVSKGATESATIDAMDEIFS